MNGDVVTITTTESLQSAKTSSSVTSVDLHVHYDHNYHEIMQEMFKSERSKVKFAQSHGLT